MVKKKKRMTRKEIDLGLEDVIKTLKSDMITALDIKQASQQLEEKVRKLRDKEIELKEVIAHLKDTRDKLYKDMNISEKKQKELESKIADLKDDKEALLTEKLTLENEVKNLRKEREQLELSLKKTNDMLMELKMHIMEFDEEIKR